MISLKVLGTAAAMVLILPMVAPTASLAQAFHRTGPGGGRPVGAAGFHGAPTARFNGGGVPAARFGGGAPRFNGGGRFARGRGGGFIPGAVAGAVIGGAIASPGYGYGYGSSAYYAPGYYDDQYYDDGAVGVAPAAVGVGPAAVGDDAVAYCIQRFQSYDPASGTYLGFDGFQHPCP